ncbi:PREDICTED: mitochondrial GTPase 1 [Polistes dominula]|uniref:Mitochondrial GTPase 1 n=1 Tax=Polistes dominula TaxID=743375 RepID=A0ABM1IZJ9_POLDO|nr:PREDICTED: mitochondrial GTPase 1 [Polistes dominula]
MKDIGGTVATTFRETFKIVNKETLRWFPGHMNKGLKQMEQRLKNVDCIIEVHDARVPISGRQADFRRTLTGLKPHIFVLNKIDLADLKYKKEIVSNLENEGLSNILFTNLKDGTCKGMKKILPLAKKLISNSERYNRSNEESFAMMIIGIPNVGKSSLINRLRNTYLKKAKATQEGPIAGVTRSVLTHIKISENPNFYLLDTPGILAPHVNNVNCGLKLALIGCLQDHLVGYITVADFLLFSLNKYQKYEYVEKLGLPKPSDDIIYILTFIAAKQGKTLKLRCNNKYVVKPDLETAAQIFIAMFRKGEFGPICLDEDKFI